MTVIILGPRSSTRRFLFARFPMTLIYDTPDFRWFRAAFPLNTRGDHYAYYDGRDGWSFRGWAPFAAAGRPLLTPGTGRLVVVRPGLAAALPGWC